MYGVVLWSSKEDSRAVIWCEDHGELAFYNGTRNSVFDGFSLDAGDLISFTVTQGRDARWASDLQLVAEQEYPGLRDNLMVDGPRGESPKDAAPQPESGRGGNVIQFVPRKSADRRSACLAS